MPIDYENLSCCRFNKNVDCAEEGRMCHKCGWNPQVNLSRMIRRFGMEKAEMYMTTSRKCKNSRRKGCKEI